jgi:hypothetical protein
MTLTEMSSISSMCIYTMCACGCHCVCACACVHVCMCVCVYMHAPYVHVRERVHVSALMCMHVCNILVVYICVRSKYCIIIFTHAIIEVVDVETYIYTVCKSKFHNIHVSSQQLLV